MGTRLPNHKKYQIQSPTEAAQNDKEGPLTTDIPDSDQEEHGHGTWIAITQSGRFSFVTNYREHPRGIRSDAVSRGYLTRDFVMSEDPMPSNLYMTRVKTEKDKYNGFNLVVGTVDGTCMLYGNRDERDPQVLDQNVPYGLSNGIFAKHGHDTWSKVQRGKHLFQIALDKATSKEDLIKRLLSVLE